MDHANLLNIQKQHLAGLLEAITHEPIPWNPWVAKVFYRRGLIETWGRGTLKIADLMRH